MGSRVRAYSPYARDAVALLGRLIEIRRKERRQTARDLAERAGITRVTLSRIESGDMRSEIGLVFEVAALVGVPLFEDDARALAARRRHAEDKAALLPRAIRPSRIPVDDDF